jgi:NitT/TauT family transport system permease protein
LGLELACVVMIFTGQVWNMTFSYYSSVRTLPNNLREAAELNSLSRWQVFKLLELPASMIGLVWNSMMSMAGGWFVLSLSEAFTLNDKSFQLPGLGSYMARAISDHNGWAEVSAVGAMFIMIIAVDQLFWRPIVAWSERFKIEDTADVNKPQSWVLSLINHSLFLQSVRRSLRNRRRVLAGGPATGQNGQNGQAATALGVPGGLARRLPLVQTPNPVTHGLSYVVVLLLAALSLWGAYSLFSLVRQVQGHDWGMIFLAFMLTFLRVLAAVFIGAAWTLPVGILIGRSAKWSQRLQPVVQIVSSFPAPMLFPLIYIVLVWLHIPFGIGCVVLMLMGTQWYTLFNVIAGAMAIPSELKEVARVYHTPRLKRWTRVYIPGVFPHLVTGLITAAGGAWNVTIVAEMLQMGHEDNPIITFGLGSMISQSSSNNFPLLAASTLTMACAVVLINRFMWKRLYRLAERRYSLNV